MELKYEGIIKQKYCDCAFSAGFVSGHPVDTMYLRIERSDGSDKVCILLRPDEAAAIAWCMSGLLWSELESEVRSGEPVAVANAA